jgi:large subunit ribosomal protein L10
LPLTKEEKEKRISELKDKFEKASLVVLTGYNKLKVSTSDQLRKQLRDIGSELKAGKNTLFKKAAHGTPVEPLSDYLVGQKSLAITISDPVALSKLLVKFAKDNETVKIEGGVLNGKYINAEDVQSLSEMPSKEVLIAKLLSVLIATPTQMVSVLAAVPRKLLYAFKAIEEQKTNVTEGNA